MAEKKLDWSDRATEDVEAIRNFFDHRNGSAAYSDLLLDKFDAALKRVAKFHELGEIKHNAIRSIIVKPYQLFYRVTKTEIIVLSVWDGRRNPEDLKVG